MPQKSLKNISEQFPSLLNALNDDRIFILALAVSIGLHVITVGVLFFTQTRLPSKAFQKLEVVYQARPVADPEHFRQVQEIRNIEEKKTKAIPQILTKKESGPQFMQELIKKTPSQFKLNNKQAVKLNSLDTKRHVSISVLETDKIMNPRYLNYQDRLRERIRDRAHSYVDNPDFEVGDVYVTFVLVADGSVKEVKIIEEKTKANDYLRNISLRSIKESEFPPFPKDFKFPELSFSIQISFEIKQK